MPYKIADGNEPWKLMCALSSYANLLPPSNFSKIRCTEHFWSDHIKQWKPKRIEMFLVSHSELTFHKWIALTSDELNSGLFRSCYCCCVGHNVGHRELSWYNRELFDAKLPWKLEERTSEHFLVLLSENRWIFQWWRWFGHFIVLKRFFKETRKGSELHCKSLKNFFSRPNSSKTSKHTLNTKFKSRVLDWTGSLAAQTHRA